MLLEFLRPTALLVRIKQFDDESFLREVFLSARPHLQALPLPLAERAGLIDQQYQFQQSSYQQRFPEAMHFIVQAGAHAIGTLVLNDSGRSLHIVDIALAPMARGQGHGTALLHWVQRSAAERDRNVTLSVDIANLPAQGLYERMGFRPHRYLDTQIDMTWTCSTA